MQVTAARGPKRDQWCGGKINRPLGLSPGAIVGAGLPFEAVLSEGAGAACDMQSAHDPKVDYSNVDHHP
jgi:hypothetical protein